MAKKQSPVSEVLIGICLKRARKEKPRADRFEYELACRLTKAIRASKLRDKPLLAVELSKLAGIALAAAESAYSGGGDSC